MSEKNLFSSKQNSDQSQISFTGMIQFDSDPWNGIRMFYLPNEIHLLNLYHSESYQCKTVYWRYSITGHWQLAVLEVVL